MDTFRLPSLDQVIKAIPLLTGYLAFLGIASALLYYYIFDINILHYISLSEAILFALDQFILFSGIFLLVFCIVESLPEKVSVGILAIAGAREMTKKHPDLAGIRRRMFRRSLYRKGGMFVFMLAITLWHPYKGGWPLLGLLALSFTCTAFGLRIFLHYVLKDSNGRWPRLVLLFSIVMTTVIVLLSRAMQGMCLKYGATTEKVVIRCKNNEIYRTSDSLLYVGRVDKFLFLYNQVLQEPEVIAGEEAVNIKWLRP